MPSHIFYRPRPVVSKMRLSIKTSTFVGHYTAFAMYNRVLYWRFVKKYIIIWLGPEYVQNVKNGWCESVRYMYWNCNKRFIGEKWLSYWDDTDSTNRIEHQMLILWDFFDRNLTVGVLGSFWVIPFTTMSTCDIFETESRIYFSSRLALEINFQYYFSSRHINGQLGRAKLTYFFFPCWKKLLRSACLRSNFRRLDIAALETTVWVSGNDRNSAKRTRITLRNKR